MIKQMKEDLVESVIGKVVVLENRVSQKEQDNDKLTEEIVQLNIAYQIILKSTVFIKKK